MTITLTVREWEAILSGLHLAERMPIESSIGSATLNRVRKSDSPRVACRRLTDALIEATRWPEWEPDWISEYTVEVHMSYARSRYEWEKADKERAEASEPFTDRDP